MSTLPVFLPLAGADRAQPVAAGSVFFSHVNDAGFWLVKEYFGLSVGQTLKTWSLMETLLSVTGLVFVLLLGLVV
jgi:gluconate:H+ symporter, GntP family